MFGPPVQLWVAIALWGPTLCNNGFGASVWSLLVDSGIGGVHGTWTLYIMEEIVSTKVRYRGGKCHGLEPSGKDRECKII